MSDRPLPPDSPNLPPDFGAALEAYTARERQRAISPAAGFADRVLAANAARRRWATAGKWAAVAAVLSLVVGGYFAVRPTTPNPPAVVHDPAPVPNDPTPPRLSDTFSEAGEALASLSQDAVGKAVEPTKALFAGADKFRLTPPKAVMADVQPAANSLDGVPAAAKSSLEPLATHTRKAVSLFLRDTGLQPNP